MVSKIRKEGLNIYCIIKKYFKKIVTVLNAYNGLLVAAGTIALVVVTYFNIDEAEKMRSATEKLAVATAGQLAEAAKMRTATEESLRAQAKSIHLQAEGIKGQTRALNLTKSLNQPFYAVEKVRLIPTGKDVDGNVFGLYMILKNYGHFIARNASCKWNIYAVERDAENRFASLKDIKMFDISGENKISAMPQSEREFFIAFLQEKMLKEYVGGYKRFININIIIRYNNIEGEVQRYACTWLIERLQSKTNTANPFDVTFITENLEKGS
jgi:hypothetical protein